MTENTEENKHLLSEAIVNGRPTMTGRLGRIPPPTRRISNNPTRPSEVMRQVQQQETPHQESPIENDTNMNDSTTTTTAGNNNTNNNNTDNTTNSSFNNNNIISDNITNSSFNNNNNRSDNITNSSFNNNNNRSDNMTNSSFNHNNSSDYMANETHNNNTDRYNNNYNRTNNYINSTNNINRAPRGRPMINSTNNYEMEDRANRMQSMRQSPSIGFDEVGMFQHMISALDYSKCTTKFMCLAGFIFYTSPNTGLGIIGLILSFVLLAIEVWNTKDVLYLYRRTCSSGVFINFSSQRLSFPVSCSRTGANILKSTKLSNIFKKFQQNFKTLLV